MENVTAAHRRVKLLDTLRGIAIIYMVFWHVAYDLITIFGVSVSDSIRNIMSAASVFRVIFIVLAGITVRFSRNAAKHGARLLLIAAGFTIVTAFFFPGRAIYFGTLHLIATGMLVYGALSEYINKIPWWLGFAVCLVIFIFTYNTLLGYIGVGGFSVKLPEELTYHSLINYFGFIEEDFYSVDYLPILPWLFLFLSGSFLGTLITEKKLPEFAYRDFCPPVTWVGRNSLIIYIAHQPIAYAILYVLFNFILRN